jgi:lycopene beta-cyclase
MNSSSRAYDVVLVGGGLQNALVALFLLDAQPSLSLCLVERGPAIGGNHTWSFHSGDVSPGARRLVDELVAHRWSGYDVTFPALERTLGQPYAAITSERLRAVVEQRFLEASRSTLLTNATASRISGTQVKLADGRALSGRAVIDARGPERAERRPGIGFQKFVGLELLVSSHGITRPILMDATVPQLDGFRFFYVLPLGPDRLLVEDTYFSTSADLDRGAIEPRILSYAASKGLEVRAVLRREAGVLPMPTGLPPTPGRLSPLVAGYAGGWFHPATGYSFPVALRLAEFLSATPICDWFGAAFGRLVERQRNQFRFGALLNWMLFTLFDPSARWNALERFYRMPEDTIRRFYALDMTSGDRLRFLCGRPPRGLSFGAVLARGVAS